MNRFDGILYINLAHRVDRKELLLNELKRLGVNDQKIHRQEAVYDPLNGHKGCTLSHIKALQYAIDQNWNQAVILEDDFIVTRSCEEVDEIFTHFEMSLGNNWDVFLIGSHIKKSEKTLLSRIHRALSAECAHGYIVNKHYLKTLQTLFLYCYSQMQEHIFFFESIGYAIDLLWDNLMREDRWYFIETFAQQRSSFSDIYQIKRDRQHDEKFD